VDSQIDGGTVVARHADGRGRIPNPLMGPSCDPGASRGHQWAPGPVVGV
jgi:hypothetical protein